MNKVCLFFTAIILSACSSLPFSLLKTGGNDLPELGKQQAGVVFLREEGKVTGPVINIYLDESYFTSLPEGNYKVARVCSQYQRISTQFSGTPIEQKYKRSQNWKLPEQEWTYLTVVMGEDGQPAFNSVDKATAEAWMKKHPKQDYTLPRERSQGCNIIPPLKQFTLEAQALFKMGQYQYSSISPKGREKITQMAHNIVNSKQEISHITVIGHTDPEGSEKSNQILSERRAISIKEGLVKGGLSADIISTEGVGSKQLKVSDCAKKHPKNAKARHACNQPNRRVEIQIHGVNQ